MKTILCYGDSNTWGSPPVRDWAEVETLQRYSLDERWSGILRGELGDGYWVVEEGLNGRTTGFDDPQIDEARNGKRFLPTCLESHQPLDLVILLLGTNDLKSYLNLSAEEIAQSAGELVGIIQNFSVFPVFKAPKVLLICPPPLGKLTLFADIFVGAVEKSRRLADLYRQQAEKYGCAFLDAGTIIQSSDHDGIHLEAPEHRKLALAVTEQVRQILG